MKMLFYPDFPRRWNKITEICRRLNIDMTNDPYEPGITHNILWDCNDRFKFPEVFRGKKVINGRCQDVTKSRVANIFKLTFGYSMKVEPGMRCFCVSKSESQAKHDGEIVEYPDKKKEDRIYLKLLDNRISAGKLREIRIPVNGADIPFLYIIEKPAKYPFRNKDRVLYLERNVDKYLTKWEQQKVIKFAWLFGIDFAELDTIRNNADGRLYIVDVNQIAGGSVLDGHPKRSEIYTLLSDSFKTHVL